jgi:hypothetical protein
MIKWSDAKLKYGEAQNGRVGKYVAFSIVYDAVSGPDEQNRQRLECFLHGIKNQLGRFSSVDIAKVAAEKALVIWLEGAGLQVAPSDNTDEQANKAVSAVQVQ